MGNRLLEKSWFSTAVLLLLLVVLSGCSLFVGVTDIDLSTLLNDREGMEAKIFLLARVPRLLAIFPRLLGKGLAVSSGISSSGAVSILSFCHVSSSYCSIHD